MIRPLLHVHQWLISLSSSLLKILGAQEYNSTSLLCCGFPLYVNVHACVYVTEPGDTRICGSLYVCMHVCGGQRLILDIWKLPVSASQSWGCQRVPPLLPLLSFFLRLRFLSPCLPSEPFSCRSISLATLPQAPAKQLCIYYLTLPC